MHDFSLTIPRCYKEVYVNSFFPCTARLWNSVPIERFPLIYDLSGFRSRMNRHLFICRFFLSRFLLCFNLFVLLFLQTPCLLAAVQPCMEWNQIKKIYETRWTGAEGGLLTSVLEKVNLFHLTGLIAVVLLMCRWMVPFWKKIHLVRYWGCLSLLSWVGALTLSLLLKLPPRKLEALFVLWNFFLLRLLCLLINLPYGLAWDNVVMSRQVLLAATWKC